MSKNSTRHQQKQNTPWRGWQPGQAPAAFTKAFCESQAEDHTRLIHAWSLKTSEAINTLIDFRSALHRWQAAGRIDPDQLAAELEKLDEAGLARWANELLNRPIESPDPASWQVWIDGQPVGPSTTWENAARWTAVLQGHFLGAHHLVGCLPARSKHS